jgi:drug/metabolite transporter (DMT)-like permease
VRKDFCHVRMAVVRRGASRQLAGVETQNREPPTPAPPAPAPLSRPLYLLCVLLFCLTWSSAFPISKIAVSVSPPWLFLSIRFLAAAGILLGFAACTGWMTGPLPWRRLVPLGLVNQAGYVGLSWVGLHGVTAGFATIVASLNPILVAVLAAPLLREPLGPRKVAGLLLGLGGAAYIMRDGLLSGTEALPGVLLQCGSLASMVIGTLAFKRFAPQVRLPIAVGVQQLAAGVALLACGLVFEDPAKMQLGGVFWASLAWQTLVVSIGAYMLWFFLLRRGSASAASALHFLMPPLGLVMSWLILGERLRLADLLGIVPIAAGIFLATRPPRRTPEIAAAPISPASVPPVIRA